MQGRRLGEGSLTKKSCCCQSFTVLGMVLAMEVKVDMMGYCGKRCGDRGCVPSHAFSAGWSGRKRDGAQQHKILISTS
jgi:hypothetical protein